MNAWPGGNMWTSIAALVFVFASPAHADLIETGQLIVGGTATVQGSAFSVGGATFSVAGGSVTFGGRINAAPAGIKWADGTTTTTGGGSSVSNLMVPLAWVNFDGTGTGSGSQTINFDVNVTSVTRFSVGQFQVNFSTPTADANYSCQCAGTNGGDLLRLCFVHIANKIALTATSVYVLTMNNSGSPAASDKVGVTCFGQPTATIVP